MDKQQREKLRSEVVESIRRLTADRDVVHLSDIQSDLLSSGVYRHRDPTPIDRALQAEKKAGKIEYIKRIDPSTGEPRRKWGWKIARRRRA